MKVGQWVKYQVIPKGKWIRTREGYIQYRHIEGITIIDVMVANTPQELVQVGDLIKIVDEYCIPITIEVSGVYNGIIETQVERVYPEHIEAIYTPNKDKTQYTEQWRKHK